jgi:hypothetical protein
MGAEEGEGQSERAANAGEEKTFGEELADDADASRAEGGAESELAGPAGGAGEQEAGDVGAGDEQDKADGGEKDQEQRLDVSDEVVFQGEEGDAYVFVGFGEVDGEVMGDGIHIGAGLREGDAGLKTADGMGAQVDASIVEGRIVPLADGGVDVAVDSVKGEAGRENADDLIGDAAKVDALTDDGGRCGEAAFPEAFAEDGDGASSEMIVVAGKGAAEDGLNAEGGEEGCGNHEAVEAFGFGGAGKVVVLVAVDGHGGEGFAGPLPVKEVGIADGGAVHAGILLVDGDEPAGIWVGQRIEDDSVDDGEERGIGADAEGQGEDGDGGEAGGFEEHAQGVTQVLEKNGHCGPREEGRSAPAWRSPKESGRCGIVPRRQGKGHTGVMKRRH